MATARNVTQKLVADHLVSGRGVPGEEIGLRIDQTLTQDATGTLVFLQLEALGLERVQTELSVQYVDHNLIQADEKNADDHRFLQSACARFGVWFSRAGNGVSHPVHQENFGVPGKTLLGSDSHTPAAGALGMLAMGAGGIEVALAMAGEPYWLEMPRVRGIRLHGELPPWVSAKDAVLELLRRHGVDGGAGQIFEYYGPGLAALGAMDRHVIANMGTELGATTSVFPSDAEVQRYLTAQHRPGQWREIVADDGAEYDLHEELDLAALEPLIALPSSPGNVRPVAEVEGEEIGQAYIGSSANPGYRDFAVAAEIVRGHVVDPRVSFDVNPTSRQMLQRLTEDGHIAHLLAAGARLHQAGCNGCIGMGQAPATDTLSLRTVPRNFPGRSGAREDRVCLVSPETAAASALHGRITDPRRLERPAPAVRDESGTPPPQRELLEPPPAPEASAGIALVKGPHIGTLPELEPLPGELRLPILLVLGDDVSTDEILPAGARVLPYRSNIERIADFAFESCAADYARRARESGGHAIVAGRNYGQGSSREHAALAPRALGLRVVLAKSFARIHRQNLIAYGVLPLTFADPGAEAPGAGEELVLSDLHEQLRPNAPLLLRVGGRELRTTHGLSERQIEIVREGGLIAGRAMRERRA